MLVLSRKENQRIKVGDNIWITIVEIRGDRVRIGIEAPAELLILREEIIPQLHAQQEKSECSTSSDGSVGAPPKP